VRLIDEKGRIFGWINIFDLLAILLIVGMVIPGVVFQHRRHKGDRTNKPFEKKEDVLKYSHVYKYAKARAFVMHEVANRIKKGDMMLSGDGRVRWQIADIISIKPAVLTAEKETNRLKTNISTSSRVDYTLGVSNRSVPLGAALDVITDAMPLASLRDVEVLIKVQCRVERDGSFRTLDNMLLLPSAELQFIQRDYIAAFIITEIE